MTCSDFGFGDYVLTMSRNEAEVLKTLTGSLTGHNPALRGVTDRLWEHLNRAGVSCVAESVLDHVLDVTNLAEAA